MFLASIVEIIQYMKEPILVGILLSISAAMLGVILVLKRYSMIGDGLSHVGFGAFAVALALNQEPLFVALPIVIVAAYVLLRMGESKKLKGDAAIALISSSALAIGYLVGNLSNGFSADIASYMFGSITTATTQDLYYILPITALLIILFIAFQNRIFAVTFDENFAKAMGIRTKLYNIGLSIVTAVIVVLGIRIMGTLLISSLIIFPALTSMRLFRRFKWTMWISMLISVVCFLIAFFCFTKYSSAASIVLVNLGFYIIATIVSIIKRKRKIKN
ncbi:MAG: metal ABC transporter permease [Bacilli bacterium]|nr:metal ABC transporter permease [Bacilli bacterium]